MEGGPFRVRRGTAFEPRVGYRRQVLVHLVDEPRLPDPGFAEDDDGLPLAVLRPLPAIDEDRQLDLAADEVRQASRCDIEPAAHPARLHDAIARYRLAHALQYLRPAVLDHEQPAGPALRRGGDHHRVGRGCALHARRDVRGLAEDLAAIGNHHRPGVQADAHAEAQPGGEGGVQRRHRVHDRQARPHRPFRVVLARRGVAPLLGVELLRERCRADQVAEEHGQLPAFAGRGGAGRRRSQRRWGGGLCHHAPGEGRTAFAAELLTGLVRRATRCALRGERHRIRRRSAVRRGCRDRRTGSASRMVSWVVVTTTVANAANRMRAAVTLPASARRSA